MKRTQIIRIALSAACLLAPTVAMAQQPATNHLTFSARFGLNISARFSGAAPIAIPPSSRTTPNGASYNYDDGYVYPDVSGSGDGYTWYWGYDNNGTQLDPEANTILLHRSSGSTMVNSPTMSDDPSPGAELTYTRELGTKGYFRFGFEAAVNYLSVGIGGRGSYALRGGLTTDEYSYVSGTTPPGATPSSPYQGGFDGPGYVIGVNPASSTTADGVVGSVAGTRNLDADLWGGRLGPYLQYDLGKNVSLNLSGGLAVGWLNTSVSWNESIAFSSGGSMVDAGSGSDQEFLVGGYVAVNVDWRLSERWSAAGSVQYQNLGTYDQTFGTRSARLDLSSSILFTIGLSYNF